MRRQFVLFFLLALLILVSQAVRAQPAEPVDSEALAFFEKEIRPLLVARCQSCHGAEKQEGKLRLTDRGSLLTGGDGGPAIVPGQPETSRLMAAVGYQGELKMPPDGKLPEADLEHLRQWIASGAPWPSEAPTPGSAAAEWGVTDAQRQWWAFQSLRQVAPPSVRDTAWVQSPIDLFVLAELESRGMSHAARASKRTLIRRATFDLTGLPPTPEEVQAFLEDDSPEAYTKLVERLLASPAYGQRWARHWLDVARYADYFEHDVRIRVPDQYELTQAWRYRDWVVDCFNRDFPYNEFVIHQIAGDLLQNPTGDEVYPEGLIATTFLANGVWDIGDADKEKVVSDVVDEQIDTIGKAFLGLTLGCARCHNHKFDPVSQADYYALAGIFYSTHIVTDLGTKGGNYTLNRIPLCAPAYVASRNEVQRQINEIQAKLAELDKPPTPAPADDPMRLSLTAERDRLQSELPPEPPLAIAIQEGGTRGGLFPNIQDVPLHVRGSYARLGEIIPRRLPAFFVGDTQPPITSGSGRRELANWVASPTNPLFARVIVNRVWQAHFGAGMVRTPNNFGMLSLPPSHPELLDWLARRLVEEGWSLKQLQRSIMLSATYQQSSIVPREQLAADPENRWLARFAARRLEAEAIRDSLVSAAGTLNRVPGGPAEHDLQSPRRALYVQTARWNRGTFAALFDGANPDASEETRNVSTVAPQSLYLMNHEFVITLARQFAERLERETPASDDTAGIQRAFEILFARPANDEELDTCRTILLQPDRQAAWLDLAHVLLLSNEFVYLD